jgi:hypothetical protein
VAWLERGIDGCDSVPADEKVHPVREECGRTDGAVKRQTLAEALEYLWQGYPIAK